MTTVRLAKLPDKKPIKITVQLPPELHGVLLDYAGAYAAAYGEEVPISELIAPILSAFLDGDRAFQKHRASKKPP
ncbi:DUF2274 domain-containing protein [Novosphingobium sp. ST904]|uniref:DUF2274 domain-containing protein n=1 Tax=Novosphingobium sp. ST904 TaxID=1684385 RepID=UPI0006C83F2B|nr:DUF2274 domain-containing protein [Novosphingobium sp. ST904]KPH69224.1 hypothetical protein ADT71_00705 [Novosphingobium sp. ST904]TCM22974.1 hypothetical protein EDF59_1685 [Novosphingobium sp. ST904]